MKTRKNNVTGTERNSTQVVLNSTRKPKNRTVLILFSIIALLFCALHVNVEGTMGVSVSIRELMILSVTTSSGTHTSQGQSSAQVRVNLSPEENQVHICVKLAIHADQAVRLQVQAEGDLLSPEGGQFPIERISWKASGNGFRDGVLSKSAPQVMGSWVGPSVSQGSVQYLQDGRDTLPANHSQTIVYTLVSLSL